MLPIFFGFLFALSWGAGDFAGGLASRKLGAYRAGPYCRFFRFDPGRRCTSAYRGAIPPCFCPDQLDHWGTLGSVGLSILYTALQGDK